LRFYKHNVSCIYLIAIIFCHQFVEILCLITHFHIKTKGGVSQENHSVYLVNNEIERIRKHGEKAIQHDYIIFDTPDETMDIY